jgi:hypothetical protein
MKRMIALLLTLTLLATLFCGCQGTRDIPGETAATEATQPAPPTPEEVLKGMIERMKTVSSFAMDTELLFEAKVREDGTQEQISLRMELPGELTLAPLAFHGKGQMTALDNQLEETIPLELSFFHETGEEEAVSFYFRSEGDGDFYRIRIPLDNVVSGEEAKFDRISGLPWTMEETETGYLLSHTITEEEALALYKLDSAAKSAEQDEMIKEALGLLNLKEEDFSKLLTGLELRLAVDGVTWELARVELDLSRPLRAVFELVLNSMNEYFNEDENEEALSIEFDGFRYTLCFRLHDYDGVAPIQSPANYEDFLDMETLIGARGDSIVPNGGKSLIELPTEGWRIEDYTFDLDGLTVRDFTEHGWVVDSMMEQSFATSSSKPDGVEPKLSEDGMIAPGGFVTITLKPAGASESACAPLELSLYSNGEESVSYLDCEIYSLGINASALNEGEVEELADFCLPLGIQPGLTQAELVELLGDPSYEDATVMFYNFSNGMTLLTHFDTDGALRGIIYLHPLSYTYFNMD